MKRIFECQYKKKDTQDNTSTIESFFIRNSDQMFLAISKSSDLNY